MSIKMAIIDGTGAWRDKTYAQEMNHSFCHQLSVQLGASAFYQRGPSFDGMSDAYKMNCAIDWLKAARLKDYKVKLMVAGYSRGAATAIAVAEKLSFDNIPVDSMFLFDSVARHVLAYGRTISGNVAFCRHAMRSQDPAFVDKYEAKYKALGMEFTSPLSSNPTRPFFGGVGRSFDKKVDYQSKIFLGSHGALGGVGWANVVEDKACQEAVAGWMTGWLKLRGVPASLSSTPPTAT